MTSASESYVRWRKSSYSTNGGNCIEIAEGITHMVPVRDSKDPHGPALTFTTEGWADFVSAVKGGQFSA